MEASRGWSKENPTETQERKRRGVRYKIIGEDCEAVKLLNGREGIFKDTGCAKFGGIHVIVQEIRAKIKIIIVSLNFLTLRCKVVEMKLEV